MIMDADGTILLGAAGASDSDSDDDMDDNEDDDDDMGDDEPAPKAGPIIDEDGFEMVVSKSRR